MPGPHYVRLPGLLRSQLPACGRFCLQGLPQSVKNKIRAMSARAGIATWVVDQSLASWYSSLTAGRARQCQEQTASLQTALLCNALMHGPRYKPHERTPFEIRRSAATVIGRARWHARQQNRRACLSFGLTSSCYHMQQPIRVALGYLFMASG
jgi:hypothetical protein